MKCKIALAWAVALCATGSMATPITVEEGKRFFVRYVELDSSFDPEFINLYSDDSRIRSTRYYPTGQVRELSLDGVQWRSMLAAALPIAKAQNDRSDYRDTRYEPDGDKLWIRADRYSLRKCYLDKGFYILLARRPNGEIFIEEQFFETRPLPDC